MNSLIKVNLKEGSFIISGSEEFIEKHKEDLKEYVSSNSNTYLISETKSCEETKQEKIMECEAEDVNKYIKAGIYAVDKEDGTISILKRIPGKNNSEKTKNIALIVLYAKGKDEKIQGSEIIGLCEKQKCYDSGNFAAIFKRDLNNFIMKGKGQSWTLQLSIPGKENAEKLLESMCEND